MGGYLAAYLGRHLFGAIGHMRMESGRDRLRSGATHTLPEVYMRLLTLLSILVLFLGCTSQQKAEQKTGEEATALATQAESKTSEELDICEAVFRHVFEHNASGQQQNANAYYLLIFGKDPTEAFLARFQEHHPPVKMGSAFVTGNGLK